MSEFVGVSGVGGDQHLDVSEFLLLLDASLEIEMSVGFSSFPDVLVRSNARASFFSRFHLLILSAWA